MSGHNVLIKIISSKIFRPKNYTQICLLFKFAKSELQKQQFL